MKTIYITIILAFFGAKINAQTWQWAEQATGSHDDFSNAIDVDNNGNSFITGKFFDSISLGTTILNAPNIWAVYLAKYDASGNLQWARIAATDSNIKVTGINLDNSGTINIVGQYKGVATFGDVGTIILTSSADYDVYVAKYDNSGTILWAQTAGGAGYDYGSDISSDNNGNIFITGEFHITPFNLSSSKVFISKYDNLGNNLWLKLPPTYTTTDYGEGIVTDSNGTSYIIGQFFNSLSFDSSIVLNAGNIESNIYIGKFNSSGQNIWLQKAGAASGYCGGLAIDINSIGESYLTGFFHGTINFDAISIAGTFGTGNEIFIAKCDSNGNYLWASNPHGLGEGRNISVNDSNECLVSGYFSGTLNFGPSTFNNTGFRDIFLFQINSAGNPLWGAQLGSLADINLGGAKIKSEEIFITGNFLDTLSFASNPLLISGSGNYDVFTAKMNLATGIEENNFTTTIKIYPNPCNSFLHVDGISKLFSIVIYNSYGQLIYSIESNKEMLTIDISKYSSGIYFMNVNTGTFQKSLTFNKSYE
ncbi:MAG: T9SS type A sorting domain-containing protein [Bacteroidota bacterium]